MTASRSCRPGRATRAGSIGPDPVLAAVAQRVGQRVEVEHRAAAAAQLAADPGQPEPGAGEQPRPGGAGACAGPCGPGAGPCGPVSQARHDLVAGQHGRGGQGEGRAGALGDLLVDLAAQRRAVERAQPGLLAEDVLGVGPGQHVALDLVDPVRELGERARLGQHGGGDGAGRGGGDDVGRDPLDADEVLQHPDLEGALGAAAGQDERGGPGAGIGGIG